MLMQVIHRHADHIRLRVSLDEPTNPKNSDSEELLPPLEADISVAPAEINTDVTTSQRPVRTH